MCFVVTVPVIFQSESNLVFGFPFLIYTSDSHLLPSFLVVRVFCSSSVHQAQLQCQNELLRV